MPEYGKYYIIHICIRSDNSVAVSYINNQGGSILSLFEEAKSIWL